MVCFDYTALTKYKFGHPVCKVCRRYGYHYTNLELWQSKQMDFKLSTGSSYFGAHNHCIIIMARAID